MSRYEVHFLQAFPIDRFELQSLLAIESPTAQEQRHIVKLTKEILLNKDCMIPQGTVGETDSMGEPDVRIILKHNNYPMLHDRMKLALGELAVYDWDHSYLRDLQRKGIVKIVKRNI